MPTTTSESELAQRAQRIVVLGVTGSGKTSLARQLGRRRGIPVHDVDALAWQPGWVKTPEADLDAAVAEITGRDAWILDALWSATRDSVLPHTELIVGLDLPRWVSLTRLIRRTAARLVARKPIHNGNLESWRSLLSSDSILAWHFRSFSRKRAQIRDFEAATEGPPVLRFTSARSVTRWLDDPAG